MKNNNEFELANNISCSNSYHEVTLNIIIGNEEGDNIKHISSLEEIKIFLEVINNALKNSINSNVVVDSYNTSYFVFMAAIDYCSIFNNINMHFFLNGKEVEPEELYREYYLDGLTYLHNVINKMQKEYDPNNTSDIINKENLFDLL